MDSISTHSTRDGERGAVLIEFALVLPLLLLLIAGMFDLGFAFQRYQAVTNAAREGARMAVLPGYSTSDVEGRVAAYLAASGIVGAAAPVVETITITPASGALFTAKRVRVHVIHPFILLGPIATLVGSTFFSTVDLTSESVMRTEVASGGS